MLERLISACGGRSIDRTLLIASAWTQQKDPLPALAIHCMALHDAKAPGNSHMVELATILHKRIAKRHACQWDEAANAVRWWLSHECPACHGLGHLKLPDAPTLTEECCPICLGSKLRPHEANGDGYARCLLLLDSAYDWARRVSECMPAAYHARELANA